MSGDRAARLSRLRYMLSQVASTKNERAAMLRELLEEIEPGGAGSLARECEICSGSLEGKRSDAIYCSAKCKQAAHRSEWGSAA